ncbi:NAD(P)-binding protein [Photobacterium lipolyticum]|uniref:FAD-dependent oxidoreductase n=1 Tax=Photobacterium lipolyticum TaxID=266810 RepID=A0A2T3MZJ3_9GAMM|nr:NAD(P)-binding protein [Photobacterium lipolyticum]PSW05397.1 FAD-dependent oxidoreductase [Photobacterium lipolyticum]
MNVNGSNISPEISDLHVGIVGGGVAGSTVALRLSELGINVTLFEEGPSLVNGPPICHLHAGGNLYREISDEQCLTLLHQSIETLRVYPHTANVRPTVIAVPVRDPGAPEQLLERLELLQNGYKELISLDKRNAVLGKPDDYFKLYQQDELVKLATQTTPANPQSLDDWMIPVAKNLNLDEFKYPVVIVQEYGLSIFRIAATASLALQQLPSCTVKTDTKVTKIQTSCSKKGWIVSHQSYDDSINDHVTKETTVDYLVNACGYRTGTLDDLATFNRHRMVEFKAAYVTHWPACEGVWPEVIFHGERGTPNGMAQLTPYPDGFFQLHGMTEDITLFKQGLVSSTPGSAQPQLERSFIRKLTTGWKTDEVESRTQRAIKHMAQFVPSFGEAQVGGYPLFGAQQIPGIDPSLRAANVSFSGERYARSEIVKASSALSVADSIVKQLYDEQLISSAQLDWDSSLEERFPVTHSLGFDKVISKAEQLANIRGYPAALARPTNIES